MAKDHGPQIKDDALYEELRKKGESKGKAARIANAKAAGTLDPQGHQARGTQQGRTLRRGRREIGIEGRSTMEQGGARPRRFAGTSEALPA